MKLITSRLKHPRCPYCHDKVRPDAVKLACNACMAWHHQECWIEGGDQCATCGQAETGKSSQAGETVRDTTQTAVKNFSDWIGLTLTAAFFLLGPCVGLGLTIDYFREEFYRVTTWGLWAGGVLTALLSAYAMYEWLCTDAEGKRGIFEDTPDPESPPRSRPTPAAKPDPNKATGEQEEEAAPSSTP